MGFVLDRQRGSHMVLRCDTQSPVLTVAVPNHKELDKGTLKGIIKQAGLTPEEFIDLLCSTPEQEPPSLPLRVRLEELPDRIGGIDLVGGLAHQPAR